MDQLGGVAPHAQRAEDLRTEEPGARFPIRRHGDAVTLVQSRDQRADVMPDPGDVLNAQRPGVERYPKWWS